MKVGLIIANAYLRYMLHKTGGTNDKIPAFCGDGTENRALGGVRKRILGVAKVY